MSDKMTIKDFVSKYYADGFAGKDVKTMIAAGWYDWFCKETSLANRLKKMVATVKIAAKSALINPEKVYVFFKNNCPLNGGTYDSFSICDIESGDVLYWVGFNVSYDNGKTKYSEVYDVVKSADVPVAKGTINDVKKFFKTGIPTYVDTTAMIKDPEPVVEVPVEALEETPVDLFNKLLVNDPEPAPVVEEKKEMPDFMDEEMLSYLDSLRESGATNMFGAAPYLVEVWPELSIMQSRKVLAYWMETFSDRHPNG